MTLTVLNPASEQPIAQLERAGVEENHEVLSRLESLNAGKPISGARGELGMAALDGYTDLENVFISTEG